MKIRQIIAMGLMGTIIFTGCSPTTNRTSSNGGKSEKEPSGDEISMSNPDIVKSNGDLSIKDFDLDVSNQVVWGQEGPAFTYKNNSKYTVDSFELEYTIKDDLSASETEELNAKLDEWIPLLEAAVDAGTADDTDKEMIALYKKDPESYRKVLKEKINANFFIFGEVKPGETSEPDSSDITDNEKEFFEYMGPNIATIKYTKPGKDGNDDEQIDYVYNFRK